MNQQIKIEVRNVYGNETYYPACETSRFFAGLAGTKTLGLNTLRSIREFGYEIVVVSHKTQIEGMVTRG